MEALASLHHRHQPLGSFVDYNCTFIRRFISSQFLSPPAPLLSPSIRASSNPTRPNNQIPQTPSNQFLHSLPTITSFAALTAVSALFFNGFCRNALIAKCPALPPIATIQESMVEEREIEELTGSNRIPFHVCSIRYLKLKVKIPAVYDFTKMKPNDQAWQALKSHIYGCREELELVKIGFEEILEKHPYCHKSYHSRILAYLEMVDECKFILKDIELATDRCERENGDMKHYLRFFNDLVD